MGASKCTTKGAGVCFDINSMMEIPWCHDLSNYFGIWLYTTLILDNMLIKLDDINLVDP